VPHSPTPPANGWPRGPVLKSPNGDAHTEADVCPERHCADVDADVDAVPQGDEEVTEQPPPTPAKDEILAGSQMPALVPVAVGVSEV
jgi:hypothetical protein